MLSQARRDKKGLSLVIGYVLLVAISIVMSVLVYNWLRTYVPTESIECNDGTSIFISDIVYDCTTGAEELEITVRNNGKFSVNGYFIHVSDNADEELATIDISAQIADGGSVYGNTNSITFALASCASDCDNLLAPAEAKASSFDASDYGSTLVKVELIPTRVQEIDNRQRLVSCSDAKIEEVIACE